MKFLHTFTILLIIGITPLWATLVDTATVSDSSITLTDSTLTDSVSKESEITLQPDSLPALKHGFFITPTWRFGSSPLITSWYQHQKSLKTYYDSLYSADDSIDAVGRYIQEPNDKSITFPFSVGFYKKIDSTKSATIYATYAFIRKSSVFSYRERTDSTLIYENSSTLAMHNISLMATFEYLFNPEYFSVKGYPRTGLTLGIGASPLQMAVLKANGIKTRDNEYSAHWSVGVFSEKTLSSILMRRVTINYLGTITPPFYEIEQQLRTQSSDKYIRSGTFGIQVTLIFNKRKNEKTIEE